MISRLRMLAILGAAAGGPYLASETEMGRDLVSTLGGSVSSGGVDQTLTSTSFASNDSPGYANHAHHEVEKLRRVDPNRYRYDQKIASKLGGVPQDGTAPSLVGSRVQDIREVLRFDISPDWVINRFSRVSTVLADLHLEALRVPIVTGTQADDMAGTLTYHFDRGHKLQRVTIHGFTGNPSRLVATMTQHYGLQKEPTLEAGVFTRRWNGHPVHFFRLTHAPVVYSDAIHQKYTVFLELNQPDLAYGISPEAQRIVASDRGSGRW